MTPRSVQVSIAGFKFNHGCTMMSKKTCASIVFVFFSLVNTLKLIIEKNKEQSTS